MTHHTSAKSKQFRPYLTPLELSQLLNLLASDTNPETSPGSRKLHSKLAVFAFKVDSGMITPSYVSTPPPSLLDKLGGTTLEESRYLAGEMDQEEETAYLNKLMGIPSSL